MISSKQTNSSFSLNRIVSTWVNRARVRKDKQSYEQVQFDHNKPDYPLELLPFHNHQDFTKQSYLNKSKILTCAWIAYNIKTLNIERNILLPTCNLILKYFLDNSDNKVLIEAINQTLVDESYHIYLIHKVNQLTLDKRKIDIKFYPETYMKLCLDKALAGESNKRKRTLCKIASAIAIETSISNHLRKLAYDINIQPMHMLSTRTHLIDEGCHSSIFKEVIKNLYPQLNLEEKHYFVSMLYEASKWLETEDLALLQNLLLQVGITNSSFISDCILKSSNNSYKEQIDHVHLTLEEIIENGFDTVLKV